MDKNEIQRAAMALPTEAQVLIVDDDGSYAIAAAKRSAAKQFVSKVRAFFKPMEDKAAAALAEIRDSKKSVIEPAVQAQKIYEQKLLEYDRKIKAKRAKIERERRAMEEQRRREIEAAKKKAATGAPVEVPKPMVVKPLFAPAPPVMAPKDVGIVYRTSHQGEVSDIGAFVRYVAENMDGPLNLLGLVTVNQTKLNALARSLKGDLDKIPGIRHIEKKTVADRKR